MTDIVGSKCLITGCDKSHLNRVRDNSASDTCRCQLYHLDGSEPKLIRVVSTTILLLQIRSPYEYISGVCVAVQYVGLSLSNNCFLASSKRSWRVLLYYVIENMISSYSDSQQSTHVMRPILTMTIKDGRYVMRFIRTVDIL